jgi:hypothetical protein
MLDATPWTPDDDEEPRAIVVIRLGYDGACETELYLDAGDEAAIADVLRQIADDVATGQNDVRH